jgi:hypothetical protein
VDSQSRKQTVSWQVGPAAKDGEWRKYRPDDPSYEARKFRLQGIQSRRDRYSNPDDDPRGPWLRTSILSPGAVRRPDLIYPWQGYTPAAGQMWRYSQKRLDELASDGRIVRLRSGMPTLKRFYKEVLERAYKEFLEVRSEIATLGRSVELVIRDAMRKAALRIANSPTELYMLEWRDLERLLLEVFEGIGFEVNLTRPSKDNGFDLQITHRENECVQVYLVEVKHWKAPSRPGSSVYADFVDVVMREGAEKGLLLSTSGFRKSLIQGRLQIEHHKVRLGAKPKIVELCQFYIRKDCGLWELGLTLPEVLFDGTL